MYAHSPSNWYHMVENISPFVISINRNWCNSVNIRSMYEAMKAEVEATELALDDVRELIWTRRKDLLSEVDRQREWEGTVQEVVKQNAGWKSVGMRGVYGYNSDTQCCNCSWETFWSMVAYNLRNPSVSCTQCDCNIAERFLPYVRPHCHAFVPHVSTVLRSCIWLVTAHRPSLAIEYHKRT